MSENLTKDKTAGCLIKCRESRLLMLFSIVLAMFLDSVLMTIIGPIVPNVLTEFEESTFKHLHLNETRDGGKTSIDDHNNTSTNNLNDKSNVSLINNQYFNGYNENLETREPPNLALKVGMIFASKPIVQTIVNPFVGPLTNKIGYSLPMFTGLVIVFISNLVNAFGETFTMLVVARAVQGIGSSCIVVSGLGMFATYFPDDAERGKAMGLALGGVALGYLIGAPFGGVMYQFTGKQMPFFILAGLVLVDGCLQLLVLKPSVKPEKLKGTSIKDLLLDPYIFLSAAGLFVNRLPPSVIEPMIPIWMKRRMNAPFWEQGMGMFMANIGFSMATVLCGRYGLKLGRWFCSFVAMILGAVSFFVMPLCRTYPELIAPALGFGFSIGAIDSTIVPHMAYLVDVRHVSVYGNAMAIADVAFSLSLSIGSSVCGVVVDSVGFEWAVWILGFISFMFAPLFILLRVVPESEDGNKPLCKESGDVHQYTR